MVESTAAEKREAGNEGLRCSLAFCFVRAAKPMVAVFRFRGRDAVKKWSVIFLLGRIIGFPKTWYCFYVDLRRKMNGK